MRLASENLKNFSAIYLFLYYLSYSVPRNEKIWKAFLKWSTLDEQSARECLAVGTDPVLKINENIFADFHSNGHFKPSEPNVIHVAGRYAVDVKGKGDNKIEDIKALEALVLHELCHWGRCRNGVEDGYYKVGDQQFDSGDMFKREAYNNPAKPHLG